MRNRQQGTPTESVDIVTQLIGTPVTDAPQGEQLVVFAKVRVISKNTLFGNEKTTDYSIEKNSILARQLIETVDEKKYKNQRTG